MTGILRILQACELLRTPMDGAVAVRLHVNLRPVEYLWKRAYANVIGSLAMPLHDNCCHGRLSDRAIAII